VRETEILVEQQPPQGVLVCDHAVINKFSRVAVDLLRNRTVIKALPTSVCAERMAAASPALIRRDGITSSTAEYPLDLVLCYLPIRAVA